MLWNYIPETKDASTIIKLRGRPSALSLKILKERTLENPYKFKCLVCARSFPRKKSLDTHKLIHSDIKKYACSFPGCTRQFKQSGQLKTHYRLHTGEKPFRCTYPTCTSVFRHSNRKCSSHPEYPLQRATVASDQNMTSSTTYAHVFDLKDVQPLYKQKVDSWLSSQDLRQADNKPVPVNRSKTVLGSIENTQRGISLDSTIYEESNKRLLSAVALVELHDQTKTKMENNNKGLLKTLLSISTWVLLENSV